MKRDGHLKLAGEVRDMQIVDCNDLRCGIADDIEFGRVGKSLKVQAILVGPGAYRGRLSAWALTFIRWMAGEKISRVPWREVVRITSVIRLEKEASVYGLRQVESALERRFDRIPGARE